MPYRRFRRRRRRTRRRRRRRKPRLRRTSRRMTTLKVRGTLLPDAMYVKLKWSFIVDVINITVDNDWYLLNGAFAPEPSPVTQPMGFDQWAAFYSRYQVFGSQINILIANRTGGTLVGTVVYPANNSGPTANFNEAKTQPYAITRYTSGVNGKPFARVKKYMSVKKLEARSTDDIDFSASVSANPTILKYWVINSQSMNLVNNMDQFYDITITYYIKFFLRLPLEAS